MIFRKVIAQHERGLVLKDKQVQRILEPGVHWVVELGVQVQVIDVRSIEVENEQLIALIDSKSEQDRAISEKHFQVVELDEHQVALVYERNFLTRVLTHGQRVSFWRNVTELRVDVIDTKNDYTVAPELVRTLARQTGVRGLIDVVYATQVDSKQLGLLWMDGELVETLQAGLHAFWKVNRAIKVEHVELRLQSMEVAGQEISTRDKVSLRINLSANYQLTDPVRARTQLQDYQGHLYRELQFALREAVGTRTLDALLADKETLNSELFRAIVKQMAEFGIKVTGVGVKDIILPGEMKEILNHVVATEKAAQANVIRRREETAATRSLPNTAKLMEANPTLLRLKEIEALEKVVEKVEKINVYDGLNGLLRDTVKLNV